MFLEFKPSSDLLWAWHRAYGLDSFATLGIKAFVWFTYSCLSFSFMFGLLYSLLSELPNSTPVLLMIHSQRSHHLFALDFSTYVVCFLWHHFYCLVLWLSILPNVLDSHSLKGLCTCHSLCLEYSSAPPLLPLSLPTHLWDLIPVITS